MMIKEIEKPTTSGQVESSTKITDLNDDCLENVFKYLKVVDLLSVAESLKYFKPAADLTFKRNYNGKRFNFYFFRGGNMRIDEDDSGITVPNVRMQLKLLRCYGKFIRQMQLGYSCNKFVRLIEQYIYKYCGETLLDLHFAWPSQETMKAISKPFTNVRSVSFIKGELPFGSFGAKIPDLAKWFPRLQDLSVTSTDHRVAKSIENHFPHLQSLKLNFGNRNNEFSSSIVAKCLGMNPQLRSLKMYVYMEPKLLTNEFKSLEFPPHLELCLPWAFGGQEMTPIQLKNVQSLKVDGKFDNIPCLFYSDQLKEVQLSKFVGSESFDELLQFMRKHSSLKVLQLPGVYRLDGNDGIWKQRLAQASKTLTQIRIDDTFFSAKEVMEFVQQCKVLQNFTCKVDNFDEFQKQKDLRFARNWKETYFKDKKIVSFERNY